MLAGGTCSRGSIMIAGAVTTASSATHKTPHSHTATLTSPTTITAVK